VESKCYKSVFQIGKLMFYERYFVMSQKAICVDCKFIVFFDVVCQTSDGER